mmetsp:Transcript_31084/g.87352  ORF Transcript_31084/g.87352 Transcript_31084/m.87352 type:complete len:236 (+) Transcript_31084:153-860(+)
MSVNEPRNLDLDVAHEVDEPYALSLPGIDRISCGDEPGDIVVTNSFSQRIGRDTGQPSQFGFREAEGSVGSGQRNVREGSQSALHAADIAFGDVDDKRRPGFHDLADLCPELAHIHVNVLVPARMAQPAKHDDPARSLQLIDQVVPHLDICHRGHLNRGDLHARLHIGHHGHLPRRQLQLPSLLGERVFPNVILVQHDLPLAKHRAVEAEGGPRGQLGGKSRGGSSACISSGRDS